MIGPPPGQPSAHSTMIGQPTAHSSMIGPPPGRSVSVSTDQGVWDSTFSRIIGRLSHQSRPESHGLSGAQNQKVYAGQLMKLELGQSSVWLDEGQESHMRPLLMELDESTVQSSGSSGKGSFK